MKEQRMKILRKGLILIVLAVVGLGEDIVLRVCGVQNDKERSIKEQTDDVCDSSGGSASHDFPWKA